MSEGDVLSAAWEFLTKAKRIQVWLGSGVDQQFSEIRSCTYMKQPSIARHPVPYLMLFSGQCVDFISSMSWEAVLERLNNLPSPHGVQYLEALVGAESRFAAREDSVVRSLRLVSRNFWALL